MTSTCPTYSTATYWDGRYAASTDKNFDWFFTYTALHDIIIGYLPRDGRKCLHVGCGNSGLGEAMAAEGYHVVNIDVSPVVIAQMQGKQQDAQGGNSEYVTADCRHMPGFDTGSFDACVDKGTLDAVACCETGPRDCARYLREVWRLLRPGGIFLLISVGVPSGRLPMLASRTPDTFSEPPPTLAATSASAVPTAPAIEPLTDQPASPQQDDGLSSSTNNSSQLTISATPAEDSPPTAAAAAPTTTTTTTIAGAIIASESALWDSVDVLLLPKPLTYLRSEATFTGRVLPESLNDTAGANKDSSIPAIGPYPVWELPGVLAELNESDYFFCYICRR